MAFQSFKDIPLYKDIKSELIEDTNLFLHPDNNDPQAIQKAAIHIMFSLYQINAQDRLKISRNFKYQTEEAYLKQTSIKELFNKLQKEYPAKSNSTFKSIEGFLQLFLKGEFDPYLLKRDKRVAKYTRQSEQLDEIRELKLQEQNKKCLCCNNQGTNLDHVLPYKYFKELDLDPDNRVMLCYSCNQAKSDMIPLGEHKKEFLPAILKLVKKTPELEEKIKKCAKICGLF